MRTLLPLPRPTPTPLVSLIDASVYAFPPPSSGTLCCYDRTGPATRRKKENRLQLATAELGTEHDNIRKAVAAHSVPEATLSHRMRACRAKKDGRTDH